MSEEQYKKPAGFFKLLFTSCLGTFLGLGLLIGAGFGIAAAVSGGEKVAVKPNSVLKLSLSGALPELTNNVEDNYSDFKSLFKSTVGLADMCSLIDIAKDDDRISGIYLDMNSVPATGWASMKTLREKLQEFKESGKFVIAYSKMYTQGSYYLASVADNVLLHPQGNFMFMGFSAQIMYYKGLMDKLGVSANIFYAGKFKSATEPFRRTSMTEPNRVQVTAFLGEMYDQYLDALSQSRNIEAIELFKMANNALIQNPKNALDYKLVDQLAYKDELLTMLRERLGIGEEAKINTVGLQTYYKAKKKQLNKVGHSDKIAVIYAEGNIVGGRGEKGSIGGEFYAEQVRKARKKKGVKAIVLRVNSGGGSALASDVIWRELELAKADGIKVVASMGDVAASGGYYISSGADSIFAEANTITGSIGVFAMIPQVRGLYEEKLGLTMDTVKIGKYSVMGKDFGMYYGFSEDEAKILQNSVEEVYTTFKTRVSEGRNMSMEMVDSVAQGRVWLGTKAKELGLVDAIGGLDAAINSAASMANLEDYAIQTYPRIKTLEEEFMKQGDEEDAVNVNISFQKMQKDALKQEFGPLYEAYETVKELNRTKGAQMRMPFELIVQ